MTADTPARVSDEQLQNFVADCPSECYGRCVACPYDVKADLIDSRALTQAQAERIAALEAEVARISAKADAEMLRVKACEHIALGEGPWQTLRNECPSTAAVAGLRDAYETTKSSLAETRAKVEGLRNPSDEVVDDALRQWYGRGDWKSFYFPPRSRPTGGDLHPWDDTVVAVRFNRMHRVLAAALSALPEAKPAAQAEAQEPVNEALGVDWNGRLMP